MTVHGAKGLQAPIVFLPDTCMGPRPQNPRLFSPRRAEPDCARGRRCFREFPVYVIASSLVPGSRRPGRGRSIWRAAGSSCSAVRSCSPTGSTGRRRISPQSGAGRCRAATTCSMSGSRAWRSRSRTARRIRCFGASSGTGWRTTTPGGVRSDHASTNASARRCESPIGQSFPMAPLPVRARNGGMSVTTGVGGDVPLEIYPPSGAAVTAGEWNAIAARNNRVEFSAVAAP